MGDLDPEAWRGECQRKFAKLGIIKSAEEAADIQNFALCVEMAIAAVGHLYAFPYNHYADMNLDASGDLRGSLIHALSFNDVLHDTVHQFAPTYHDYILYSFKLSIKHEQVSLDRKWV